MCVVSNIMDQYGRGWGQPYDPFITPPTPQPAPRMPTEKEIEEFRRLLERARQQDIEEGNPDCETEQKKGRLLEVARELGIEAEIQQVLDEVLG